MENRKEFVVDSDSVVLGDISNLWNKSVETKIPLSVWAEPLEGGLVLLEEDNQYTIDVDEDAAELHIDPGLVEEGTKVVVGLFSVMKGTVENPLEKLAGGLAGGVEFTRLYTPLPDGHSTIIEMLEHKGDIYVATDLGIFKLVNDELVPIRFVTIENEQP